MATQPNPVPPEGMPQLLVEGYLTTKEAAERMGLSVETVRAMCSDGILAGAVRERDNGPWHIPKETTASWLARQSKRRHNRQIVKWGAIVTLLALLFAAGSFIADSLNVADRWRVAHPTPTPMPFERAKADETLILIASFDYPEGIPTQTFNMRLSVRSGMPLISCRHPT